MEGLGFHSALLLSAGSHNDALQMADVIVGCVTSWVKDTDAQQASQWLIDRVRQLRPLFRGGVGGMFGDGFVIWPYQNQLWQTLQASIR